MAPPDSRPDRLPAGTELSHYRIEEMLGAGGMGVVYRATDLRLNRSVALKVMGRFADDDLDRRFLKEARAASSFTHPNIVTIHEVDSAGGVDFIVMELLSGRSLDKLLTAGSLSVDDVLAHGEQIAAALAAADHTHIVHRDIKPANVMLTDSGHVKVLDFGIAKQLSAPAAGDAVTETIADPTRPGAVLGSVAYMSPEQAQGHAVDGRSDVFSFGVLLYEMLAGRRPFGGTTAVETVAQILEATPPPIDTIRRDVPASLRALVEACLSKDRAQRPTAADVHRRLTAIRAARGASQVGTAALLRRRGVVGSAAAVVMIGLIAGGWWWVSGSEVRDARRRLPVALRLAERDDAYGFYHAAFPLVKVLPDDPQLRQRWNDFTFPVPSLTSEPPGAEVWTKGYTSPEDAWIFLGRTPLENPRFPRGTSRVRIVKDGFTPYDGTLTLFATEVRLQPVSSTPQGMTYIPSGPGTNEGRTFVGPAFWMDRFEVSNREFKTFIEAGGYTRPEFWKVPFVEDGHTLPWREAITRFRDRTGRPGPSTWALGTYPGGEADLPVAGVSWYEAAAYAAFVDKALPTAFQWRRAGDFAGPSTVFSDILLTSNFGGKGPIAVGSRPSIGPYGQFDMAGNVKEWCWNESRNGRMILGGSWNEPPYMYEDRDAQPAFARLETYGFRLVKNIEAQPQASYGYVPRLERDFSVEKPIDDRGFALLANLYRYDPTPLNPRSEGVEEAADWRHEILSIDAPYANERILIHAYLPKTAAPPYQPVVYFPGGDAQLLRSSRDLNLTTVDFVIRSGRAVLFPVYKGTYERAGPPPAGPNGVRDLTLARSKDVRRVIDYIATRTDLDRDRIAYYGVSMGAYHGVLVGAIEPRLKALVFLGGGFPRAPMDAAIDLPNFAPRIRVPTLMVNGARDFQIPLQTSQLPLFQALGVDADQKKHALFNGGHLPYQVNDVIREILDWLDRFLGPIQPVTPRGSN